MSEAPIVGPALAGVLSAAGIWLLRRRLSALPRDVPNARSLHSEPVPRAGGYAIWTGFVPVVLLYPPPFPGGLLGWLPAWLALVAVSGRDDVRHVGVGARLGVHALAASWTAVALVAPAWSAGADGMTALVTAAGIALVIAWSANLYNFMDGTDGLAATMAAVGFGAYGVAAVATSGPASTGAAPALLALAAATLPFLGVNLPRAAMFLGDVGAVPLGFLAAAFGIAGVVQDMWPGWFPLLVFLPFVADATFTLAQRLARGERVWEAHRAHHYQRLAQMRAGHAGTLAVYAALMIGGALTAVGMLAYAPARGWWALTMWCAVVIIVFATIDYHWRKNTNTGPLR